MYIKTLLSLLTITSLTTSALWGAKFETIGYKAISMGGASVASSSGSIASYNNPALLAKAPYSVEISTALGVAEQDHGAGASIAKLNDLGFMDTLDKASKDVNSLSLTDRQNLVESTDILINMDEEAISLLPQAYLGAQVGGFGFGLFASTDSLVTADVDQQHDQLIFENSDGSYSQILSNGDVVTSTEQDYNSSSIVLAVNSGLTYLDVQGVALSEIPLAYGHAFETRLGNIMLGGALKYMEAVTFVDQYTVDGSGEISGDTATRHEKRSADFGIDLGVAYQPSFSYDLTVGLVAKNLNTPSFEYIDGSSYSVEPLVRAGFAYQIFESLEVAADIDLTSNSLLSQDLESQMVGGGVNFEPFSEFFALSLRAGLMQNLHKNDKAGLIYTGGVGLGVKWFQLDLSGEVSNNVSTAEGTTVPQYAKINLALISRW